MLFSLYSFIIYSIIFLVLLLSSQVSQAQDQPGWSLQAMIQYATENNIQVKQAVLNSRSTEADYEQARASRLPSLSAVGQQTLTAGRSIDPIMSEFVSQDIHSTSLGLSSEVTLFNGNRLNTSIKQNALLVQAGKLEVEEAKNSIVIALTQSYLQALYLKEGIAVAEETVSSSQKQVEQTQQLFAAGSASGQELAQVKAQVANDRANLISAQNQYAQQILSLKQLLELEIQDEFDIAAPELGEELNLRVVSKEVAYQNALAHLPQVKSSQLALDAAELGAAQARAGLLPTVSLAGSIGTGYTSVQNYAYLSQLDNNQNKRIGLVVSIPIFNRRQTSTNVQKANIAIQSARLDAVATQKEILQIVESTYQNVLASQSQLEATQAQLEAAAESHRLAEQQFELGILNLVDYILERTNLQLAQQAYLQAKYTAILNYQLLEFYQGNTITL